MFAATVTTALRRAVGTVVCAVAFVVPLGAAAQDSVAVARLKIAPDLLTTVGSSVLPDVPWARLLNGELLVRALVVANSDDASLAALRRNVVAMGGAVTYNYTSIRALAVMVPASRLVELAQLREVASISPNRAVTRTASVLQATTGASEAEGPARNDLDGSGVGIAVLDSGIAWNHQSMSRSFLGLKGLSRGQAGGRLRRPRQGPDRSRLGARLRPLGGEPAHARRHALHTQPVAAAAAAPADARPVRPRLARGLDRRRQRQLPVARHLAASRRTPTCTTSACSTTTASATWPT